MWQQMSGRLGISPILKNWINLPKISLWTYKKPNIWSLKLARFKFCSSCNNKILDDH